MSGEWRSVAWVVRMFLACAAMLACTSVPTMSSRCVNDRDCVTAERCGSDGECHPVVTDAGVDPPDTQEMAYLPEGEGEPQPTGSGGGGPTELPENDCVSLPLTSYSVTGYRFGHPVGSDLHLGEDVAGRAGDPVVAPFRGEVIYAFNHRPYRTPAGQLHGNWGGLVLLRALGLTPVVVWVGGHLDPTDLPRVGQIVERGARLGRLARQDQIGYGEHLHSQLSTGDLPARVVSGYATTTGGWQAFSVFAQSVAAMCRRDPVTPSCPTGRTPCLGACVDLLTNTRNCGACGFTCPSGYTCAAGRCAATCPTPRLQCGSDCVDPLADASHCGACGRRCSAGQTCSAGSCRSVCATECSGACVDVGTNVNHCGGCNRVCSIPRATAACVGGACQVAVCTAGFVDCNRVASDGCETDVSNDRLNCGACGLRCGASDLCIAGRCVTPACNDYLWITTPPSPVSTRPGATLRIEFTAPGCPASQPFEVRVRACCVSGDCVTGYAGGNDPDARCGDTGTSAFTGTRIDLPFSSAFPLGWYRLSVRPVGLDRYAAPFIRVQMR